MSRVASKVVELKHDKVTNTTIIRVPGGVANVPAKDVIRHLGSGSLAERTRKKLLGPVVPVTEGEVTSCRVRFAEPLDYDSDLDLRAALKKGGFQCV